jgi:MoxR-like ATPase
VLDQDSGEFRFRPGPVFTNLLLADEINRTPPKTQAALLEAMAELQVSIDGRTHRLPSPFIVLATDNPIEYEGTYPLPEAQLDRFGIRMRIGYLPSADEVELLRRRVDRGTEVPTVGRVLDAGTLLAMRDEVDGVAVADDVLDYVVRVVSATRDDKDVLVGASPRASLALLQLARSRALLSGRDYVVPEDVKTLAIPALAHRLSLRPEMWVRRVRAEDVLGRILSRVSAPRSASRQAEPAR